VDFRFCPRCATSLVEGDVVGRTRRHYPNCRFIHCRNPIPVAGCLIGVGSKV